MPIEIVALDRGFRSTMLLWAHDRFVGSDLCLDSHVSKMWSADDSIRDSALACCFGFRGFGCMFCEKILCDASQIAFAHEEVVSFSKED